MPPIVAMLVLALILGLCPTPTQAETGFWESPAFSDMPLRGPALAKGVVVYNHGIDDTNEQYQVPVQPYIHLLAEDGWDVVKLNRRRAVDEVSRAEDELAAEVASLERRGYRRIALAGQSRGAWLALMVATRRPIFAVIAAAPGGYGAEGNGLQRSIDDIRARLPHVFPGTRVMVMDFAGDVRADTKGGRGAIFRDALAQAGAAAIVLDKPPGFVGHTSAMTGRFARIYGNCITRFLDPAPLPENFSCDTSSGPAVAADLPLPPDALGVPARGLLGPWVGIYTNGDARILVVTQAQGNVVQVVWSWSDGPLGKKVRAPGFDRMRCSLAGHSLTCPRPKGVLVFDNRGDNHLDYQWIPSDTKVPRLSMELSRPGQW